MTLLRMLTWYHCSLAGCEITAEEIAQLEIRPVEPGEIPPDAVWEEPAPLNTPLLNLPVQEGFEMTPAEREDLVDLLRTVSRLWEMEAAIAPSTKADRRAKECLELAQRLEQAEYMLVGPSRQEGL